MKYKDLSPFSKTLISKKGFTLIELLLVVAVIGILSVIIIIGVNPTQRMAEARDAQRKTYLKNLQTALETYYVKNLSYPTTSGTWRGEPSGYGGYTTNYIPNLVPDYVKVLPNDPRANQVNPITSGICGAGSNGFLYRSNGVDYKLLDHCAPESYPTSQLYYDPIRPTWAWQVSSPGGSGW